MLPIHKNAVDPLREHRSRHGAVYANIPTEDREHLVRSLLQEQKYLCAYCMRRINVHNIKVEHWKCQSSFPYLQIEYNNLLAVCDGNEGHPQYEQHCDTQKGNASLKYNPANPEHYVQMDIRYVRGTGKIESGDEIFSSQLGGTPKGDVGILNLNYGFSIKNRKKVIESVMRALNTLPPNASKAQVRPLLEKWTSPDAQGMLKEYAGVAIYFLEKRLKVAR